MRLTYWRSLLMVCACLLWIVPTGCGKHALGLDAPGASAPASTSAPDLSLDAAAPAGVDPALWARLSAALRSAVEQRGKSVAAIAPVDEASRVDDFVVVPDTQGAAYASWTYRNPGDYNQNGTVGTDDLVPLAMFYALDSNSPEWPKASGADGNGDGRIDIGDVVLIGQNFGHAISGFTVQRGASPDESADWAGLLNVPFSSSTQRTLDGRREFRPSLAAAQAGRYYRVLPYLALAGSAASYGLPSNACRYYGGVAGAGAWPMPGGNPQHSSYSPTPGPAQLRVRWFLTAADFEEGGWITSPVIGRDGAVYLAQITGLQAFNPDGSLRWRWVYPTYECHNPVLGADGTIYILSEPLKPDDDPSTLFALGNDGKLKWQLSVPGTQGHMVVDGASVYVGTTTVNACYGTDGATRWSRTTSNSDPGAIAVDQQGNAYFVNGFVLAKYLPSGGQDWIISLPGAMTTALTIRPDGVVLAPTASGLYAYDGAGQELWHGDALTRQVKTLAVASNSETVLIADPEDPPSGRMVLAVLNANGELQQQMELGYQSTNPFLVLDSADNIYLHAYGAGLHCLTTAAVERWRIDSPGDYGEYTEEFGCAIDADGALYVSNGNYAFCLAQDGTSPPAAPTVTASDAQFFDHVHLNWSAVPGADCYRVYRDNLTAPLVTQTGTGYENLTGTEYDDYSVLDTTYHTYTVCAFSALGKGAPSKRALGRLKPSGLDNLGAGDWRTYGHDPRRTFCSNASGPVQGQVRWTHTPAGLDDNSTNDNYAPVFGADGTLYAAYYEGRLEALSPDGAQLWRLDFPGTLNRPSLGPDGTLYFGTTKPGYYRQGPPPPAPSSYPPFWEQPYELSTATIHALAPDRTQRWQFEIAADPHALLPEITVGDDGAIYSSASDTWLLALAPDGRLRASCDFTDASWFDHDVSIGPDNSLYVLNELSISRPRLLQLDPLLNELWHYTWYASVSSGRPVHAPAIAPDGTLYMAGSTAVTGTPAGGFSLINPGSYSRQLALATSGRVYVGNNEEYATSPPSGLGYLKQGVFIEVEHMPQVLTSDILLDAEGKVYFTAKTATAALGAYCIDAGGNLLWSLDLPGAKYRAELSFGNDGTLYAMSSNKLYAVSEP
jgi:hypothetical protein